MDFRHIRDIGTKGQCIVSKSSLEERCIDKPIGSIEHTSVKEEKKWHEMEIL